MRKKTKTILLIIATSLVLIILAGGLGIFLWIDRTVKKNMAIAQARYPGTAEQALLALLQDERNSFRERTHLAIWTLGRLKSQLALPVLQQFYKDDPEGMTCYGRHDNMLCQYELYKAIKAIIGQ